MLPIQKRLLPLSKIVDLNYYYHQTDSGIGASLRKAGLKFTDTKSVDPLLFGRDSFDIMNDLLHNDLAGLERYIREKMTKIRFNCVASAERYVNEHGKIMKLFSGNWRAIVNINGVKCLCYNTTRDLAVRDAAVQLQQEFPEIPHDARRENQEADKA